MGILITFLFSAAALIIMETLNQTGNHFAMWLFIAQGSSFLSAPAILLAFTLYRFEAVK